jgi:putative addiction module component (TIGR02574 family)
MLERLPVGSFSMASLITSLGIDRLDPSQKIQLVGEILDSLDGERELPPLTEAQRQELDRRLAILAANPAGMSTWEEVEALLMARLRR